MGIFIPELLVSSRNPKYNTIMKELGAHAFINSLNPLRYKSFKKRVEDLMRSTETASQVPKSIAAAIAMASIEIDSDDPPSVNFIKKEGTKWTGNLPPPSEGKESHPDHGPKICTYSGCPNPWQGHTTVECHAKRRDDNTNQHNHKGGGVRPGKAKGGGQDDLDKEIDKGIVRRRNKAREKKKAPFGSTTATHNKAAGFNGLVKKLAEMVDVAADDDEDYTYDSMRDITHGNASMLGSFVVTKPTTPHHQSSMDLAPSSLAIPQGLDRMSNKAAFFKG